MAINKIISMSEAVNMIKDDSKLMLGGFNKCGVPLSFLKALSKSSVKDLTIMKNDTDSVGFGVYDLFINHQIKEYFCSHIGTNKESIRQTLANEIIMNIMPQGTFAERVRCGGAGLGGVLTPTGIGTVVEEGKKIIEVDGKKYILETPLRGDVSVVKGSIVDKSGNVFCAKTSKNFNPIVAMASDICIVEADEIVEVGQIDPELISIPNIVVDYIVKAGS